MTSRNKLLRLFALAAIILTLFSCGNKMTREKAKELITQKFNFPSTVTEKLQHGEINYMRSVGGSNISAETTLAEQKLITFNYQGDKRDMFFSYATYFLDLTPEGQKYKTGETSDNEGRQFYIVKVADKVFVDLTGILEINDGKAAQVDYTWKYDNITPFGNAFSLRNQQLNRTPVYNEGQLFSNKVMMVKYDDGWRIQEQD